MVLKYLNSKEYQKYKSIMFREMKRVVVVCIGLFVIFFFVLRHLESHHSVIYSEREALMVESQHLRFHNPLLNSNDSVGKKVYSKLVWKLPDNKIDSLVKQFNVKGTEYLSPETKRNFLWCDAEMRTHQPLKMFDRGCSEVGFKEDSGKKVALASFPGSGSTWSRTLLEQATGVFTGAIYCDRSLKAEGFVGEYITTRNVIAIKTHSPRVTKIKYDAAIFIVRNIADAMKSEINRRSSHKNHTGTVDESEYGEFLKCILMVCVALLCTIKTKTKNLQKCMELYRIFRFQRFQQDFKQAVRDFKGVAEPPPLILLHLQLECIFLTLCFLLINKQMSPSRNKVIGSNVPCCEILWYFQFRKICSFIFKDCPQHLNATEIGYLFI